jgi:hypothetical protein
MFDDGPIRIYARWVKNTPEIDTYKVIFNYNHNNVPSNAQAQYEFTATIGQMFNLYPDLSQDKWAPGYTATGWFLDNSIFLNPWTPRVLTAQDFDENGELHIYARWIKK